MQSNDVAHHCLLVILKNYDQQTMIPELLERESGAEVIWLDFLNPIHDAKHAGSPILARGVLD